MARKKQTTARIDDRRARVECFLLCDYARVENNKLYIVGGGWDQIVPQTLPLIQPAFLAVKIVLPGVRAVASVKIRIDLLDREGTVLGEPPIEGSFQAVPVEAFEEGQEPPKAPVLLAVGINLQFGTPGEYRVRLLVDDEALAEADLTVAPPLLTQPPIDSPG